MKVLIYRLGSLGDTVIALPVFHLIARTFPNAERYLLGSVSIANQKTCHPQMVLAGTGLVHGYLEYPVGLRDLCALGELRDKIRLLSPDILIYLAEARGLLKTYRDILFFRLCGVRRMIGVPYTTALQQPRWFTEKECFEYEAERLARCVSKIGDARLNDRSSWDLHLSPMELGRIQEILNPVTAKQPIIAASLGTKVDVKHWGRTNWECLFEKLGRQYSNYALVFIGAKSEYAECERAGECWQGKKLNLCGLLSPRESAAALQKASLFIGHDTGPMHLAASVGTSCIAIFSARNKPGVWFPYGNNHRVIYHQTPCYGCRLEICESHAKKCITSITVEEVENAVHALLQ